MATTQINGNSISLRQVTQTDFLALSLFLENLSDDSRRRFGPHRFDTISITEFYAQHEIYGFLAEDAHTNQVIAYTVVKRGFWLHDEFRYVGYGLSMSPLTDATFAPAVADKHQGTGVGFALLRYTLDYLKSHQVARVFLWGGVQADNQKAVRFYERNGFKTLGGFEYHGYNYDMVLEL